MPSVDHCLSKPTEMATITNSLEVFDKYKPQEEDKESDEESFHLPIDDDESESKFDDVATNGNSQETEEDILNKFEAVTTPRPQDSADSQLEGQHLKDDESKHEKSKNGINGNLKPRLEDDVDGTTANENKVLKRTSSVTEMNEDLGKSSSKKPKIEQCEASQTDKSKIRELFGSENQDEVPKVKVETESCADMSSLNRTQTSNENRDLKVDKPKKESANDEADVSVAGASRSQDDPKIKNEAKREDENKTNSTEAHKNETKNEESGPENQREQPDKCENSNDSSKTQNYDSEDLMDISVIRDAEEDNAESAYNEAHPEESEDCDDRNSDKLDIAEDDGSSDKAENIEEDDVESDKVGAEQLKSDDVEIEETNLKDCDLKEPGCDADSDNSNSTSRVESDKVPASSAETECTLNEFTGQLTNGANVRDSFSATEKEGLFDKSMDVDSEDERRKLLKRALPANGDSSVIKKSRTDEVIDTEAADAEKAAEKKQSLVLQSLLSLSEFMNSKKSKKLSVYDLEEFCLQKICEAIVHKSELGDVHHQLKLQEQLIETMRKEIQQLTKQTRDLEIVNKKLMNDLKQQTATQKPLSPLKITRSVGLQVKFTPAYDNTAKRRQPATSSVQKVQASPQANKGQRNIPNSPHLALNRQQQVNTPQKQPTLVPKPTTPLLSQALQNRRSSIIDATNRTTPQATPRTKPADGKGASASVIDLTDEDDKKDKKNVPANMPQNRTIAQKNATSIPIRTATAPVRTLNSSPQGIRLTTSQGKVTPITSVVTSSAPQLMYVVQSSPQSVLSPLGNGPKAVVVNFQSTNGVLTSTLNGSAVSVIPKSSNTIQLKTVAPAKSIQPSKVLKPPNKHPAPLPAAPVVRVNSDKPLKPIPPKPHLSIRKTDTGIILQWKMPYELDMYEVIASYQLYAYQETSAMPNTDMWRRVGDVKALALPMACTLTQFADKNKYYFAVRPVDIHKRIGAFSEPEEISL